mgnify:CR=1 FL=1
MKIFINDSVVVINNKFESRIFVYDRLQRIEYEINEDCFNIIYDIKNSDYEIEYLYEMYGKNFIDQLFKLNILTQTIQKNINNVKKLTTYNNVRIFVELTNKCNLKCKHCYGGFACTNNTNLDIDLIKKMIDEASANGVYQFEITGGEPTLYPYLEELMDYVYNAGMLMRIFTNLTTYTEKFKNLILKYGVKDIVTSLDSCIKEDHEEFRGQKGCFDKTLNAIQDLKKEDISISLNTMIGNHNKNNIEELIVFINNLKLKSVLDVIVPEGRATELNEDIKESAHVIKKIYEMNSNKIDKEAISISCGVGNRFIYVKSNGSIYLCPSLIKEEYKLGNIENFNTMEIWKLMTNKFSNLGCSKKSEKCKNCTGGCRARALSLHRDINSEDDVYCAINGVEE